MSEAHISALQARDIILVSDDANHKNACEYFWNGDKFLGAHVPSERLIDSLFGKFCFAVLGRVLLRIIDNVFGRFYILSVSSVIDKQRSLKYNIILFHAKFEDTKKDSNINSVII